MYADTLKYDTLLYILFTRGCRILVNNHERRKIERLKIPDIFIQFKIDDPQSDDFSIKRKVRDISYNGLSFNRLSSDFLEENREYSIILIVENKSILIEGRIVYSAEDYYGFVFKQVDTKHLVLLVEFLDPAYAGENMQKIAEEKIEGGKRYIYESDAGAVLEYLDITGSENFKLEFYDKIVEWDPSYGLRIGINDDITRKKVFLSTESSLLNEIITQAGRLIHHSRIENKIKKQFRNIIANR
jgi:hypothetical protein